MLKRPTRLAQALREDLSALMERHFEMITHLLAPGVGSPRHVLPDLRSLRECLREYDQVLEEVQEWAEAPLIRPH